MHRSVKLGLFISSISIVSVLSSACGGGGTGGGSGAGGGATSTDTTSSGISCTGCFCCSSNATPGMHYTCPTAELAGQACSGGAPPAECIAGDGDCP